MCLGIESGALMYQNI